jgi:hypothetical protein
MRNFKIHVLIAFLLSFFSLNAIIKDKDDSVRVKMRKNSIRLEIGAKSPYCGLLYERELFTKKWSAFISIGAGFGDTRNFYPCPTMFNVAFYTSFSKWRIKPVLGFGSLVFVEYSPYPATKTEREVFRKTGGDGGPGLSPPFTFMGFVMVGGEFKITQRISIQILYTPLFRLNDYHWFFKRHKYSSFQYSHFGGINIGYKF